MIYLSWSWRTDTHGYSKKKPIHPKLAYVFFEIFSKSSQCIIATYWYIVIGTVKQLSHFWYTVHRQSMGWIFNYMDIYFIFICVS